MISNSDMRKYAKTVDFSDYDELRAALDAAGLHHAEGVDWGSGPYLSIMMVDVPKAILQVWHPKFNAAGEDCWVFVFGEDASEDTEQDELESYTSMDVIVQFIRATMAKITA